MKKILDNKVINITIIVILMLIGFGSISYGGYMVVQNLSYSKSTNTDWESIKSVFDHNRINLAKNSDLHLIYPATNNQVKDINKYPNKTYNLKDRYYGVEFLTTYDDNFCIYLTLSTRGINNVPKSKQKNGTYCIKKGANNSEKFASSGTFKKIEYGHGNDATYNPNTNKYIIADNSSGSYSYVSSGMTVDSTEKTKMNSKGSNGTIAYNNDIYNINNETICEADNKDFCSFYFMGVGDEVRLLKLDGSAINPAYTFKTKFDYSKKKIINQTIEYHKGYIYRVYSIVPKSNKNGGYGVIDVYNAKLNPDGSKTMDYGKHVATLWANFLTSSINKKEPSSIDNTRTRHELEAVSFPDKDSKYMYILTHARRYNSKGSEVNRYPYIYKVDLTTITSNITDINLME